MPSVSAVLQTPALVEHALRQTLAADALSLQLKLPPPGVPPSPAQTSPDLACGTAVVDVLAVTSVWVVKVLRMLCAVRHIICPLCSRLSEILSCRYIA